MLSALVHTQGVVLGSTYFPLEMAYHDVLGVRAHLLIASPLPYAAMRKLYPRARPDALVVTTEEGATPYAEALDFLRCRSRCLAAHLPAVVFGCKGRSYQPQILLDAGLGGVVNVEALGVPPLRPTPTPCRWHRGAPSKCAAWAVEQMLRHLLPPPRPETRGAASPAPRRAAPP